jgi:hypothetical protein
MPGLSFQENEGIECGDYTIDNFVMDHVAVCLFNCQTAMVKTVQRLTTLGNISGEFSGDYPL